AAKASSIGSIDGSTFHESAIHEKRDYNPVDVFIGVRKPNEQPRVHSGWLLQAATIMSVMSFGDNRTERN
ncbi:unnamed protein product, partial [Ilex paraguariensis]